MGNFINKAIEKLMGKREARLLMLGLDAAGKTTILYKLAIGETVKTIPTIGFNVEEVVIGKTTLNIWDVGGQDKIRPLWRHYYQGTEGVVFVVDSNDASRIEEAREQLEGLMSAPELADAALLVFANKQDLPRSMNASELADKLGLHKMHGREWYIQSSNAISGDGLVEGIHWLTTVAGKTRPRAA